MLVISLMACYKSGCVRGDAAGGEGGWVVRGGLYPVLGLFGLAMNPRMSAICLKDISVLLESTLDPCLLCSALYGSYFLTCDFTWVAKLALEKLTSQLSLVMPLCTGIV